MVKKKSLFHSYTGFEPAPDLFFGIRVLNPCTAAVLYQRRHEGRLFARGAEFLHLKVHRSDNEKRCPLQENKGSFI